MAAAKKPNILVIFGDDIGQSQISAYTMGVMGYRTPNIDRIANEGIALRTTKLHSRPRFVYSRPRALPHRAAHHRHAR